MVMNPYMLETEKYAALARRAAAEGCVLLENTQEALPLRSGDRVAVFGRIAFTYYKSGLGSGGMVNTGKVDGILDSLCAEKEITVDETLMQIYKDWILEHPFDEGQGWGKVPWSQKEMPVTEEMLQHAQQADAALVIIGRTAGEDQDNLDAPGGYRLTEEEETLIREVSKRNARTAVILNMGGILDLNWIERCGPAAILCAWQGGEEGGHGAADVLMGREAPSGHLTDTIAYDLKDYPSDANFGGTQENIYQEDIYVGYRYFETFAKDRVRYPFGYGLSYTTFEITGRLQQADPKEGWIDLEIEVRNTGNRPGKAVAQIYAQLPQGKLGNPSRRLVGFFKTDELQAGSTVKKSWRITAQELEVYDDSGKEMCRSAWILPEGEYIFYVGENVRDAKEAARTVFEGRILEELEEVCAPVQAFQRMRPDGEVLAWEAVPLRTADPQKRRKERLPEEIPYTGDQGCRLADVADGKVSMQTFLGQLSDEDLMHLFHGEGMCSPKVTPGTAGAFGGLTEHLQALGIPAGCCADGPSGIRMDCGTRAFSLPNGTLLGCTFHPELVEELYACLGKELRLNRIEALLGPGINLHRHPLNGRNFEYVSEDPYLTGKIAAAQIRGMDRFGVAGTLKHFCANNQEAARTRVNSVVSERALRELYLKGFEIVVKESPARSVMTTYGPLNGTWTAGSYDLCTTILRKEWGFKGIVMTDWWGTANEEGRMADAVTRAPMVAAQNDLYMVTADTVKSAEEDDVLQKLRAGEITRGELQRNAANILEFLMQSPAFLRLEGRISEEEQQAMKKKQEGDTCAADLPCLQADERGEISVDTQTLHPRQGLADVVGLRLNRTGKYQIRMRVKSDLSELAQLSMTIYVDNVLKTMVTLQGTNGSWTTQERPLDLLTEGNHYMAVYYGSMGIEIGELILYPEAEN